MSDDHVITTPDELDAYLKDRESSGQVQCEEVPRVSVAVVRVNGRLCALSAEGLKQVFRATSIAPVPGCARVIAGLASVGGTIIGVVDTSELLSASDSAILRRGPILIYEHAEERIGLLVSAVEEIASVPSSVFRKLDCDQVSSFVASEVQYADRYLPHVDVHEALSSLLGEEMHA